MTLEQLRIFIAVAERQHLTRAAESLHLTQSAVSSAISTLEARYGVKLFDRIGRGIVLTEMGRVFLPEARTVLASAHGAEQALNDAAGGLRGHLRVAASQTVGNYWLAERLARFRSICPGVTLSLMIGNTQAALAQVLAGEADLAVVEGRVAEARLAVTRLEGDAMCLVMPVGHRLSDKDILTVEDWSDLSFVVREPGSGTRAILSDYLTRMGLSLGKHNIVMELPSNEAVRGAVEAGLGASILSSLVVERGAALYRDDIGIPSRDFCLIRLKAHSETRAENAFMRVCVSG